METIKTGFTYVIALVVLVGSGALLVLVPDTRFESVLPFVTAIDGAVVAYVFAREQTQIVQSGNGLERRSLEAVHRRLDTELPAIRHAMTGGPLTADTVAVEGEHVNVTSSPDPGRG